MWNILPPELHEMIYQHETRIRFAEVRYELRDTVWRTEEKLQEQYMSMLWVIRSEPIIKGDWWTRSRSSRYNNVMWGRNSADRWNTVCMGAKLGDLYIKNYTWISSPQLDTIWSTAHLPEIMTQK